ncbi:MAG: HEAT repeat domain-containing protein, partial [Chloroflexi bacterium]|nr:HEAT repeat domain-containing protein [Chloroflexota bacterium]
MVSSSTVKRLVSQRRSDEIMRLEKDPTALVAELINLAQPDEQQAQIGSGNHSREQTLTRLNAILTLGDLGERRPESVEPAVAQLCNMLEDQDQRVAVHAADALGRIGANRTDLAPEVVSEVVSALTGILRAESSQVRRYAIGALGVVGQRAPESVDGVINTLAGLLGNDESDLRGAAVS